MQEINQDWQKRFNTILLINEEQHKRIQELEKQVIRLNKKGFIHKLWISLKNIFKSWH